ncbi:MAG: hypothetical protein J2P43_03625 [Candidatus Dormibacteraeota bacterium]|nr:hypothetical protein [Candidatus Dormibacteraeota bacterium]MBO0744086.1 hypothetical protein [Candidatus Dormibacteraeota bacterium]
MLALGGQAREAAACLDELEGPLETAAGGAVGRTLLSYVMETALVLGDRARLDR